MERTAQSGPRQEEAGHLRVAHVLAAVGDVQSKRLRPRSPSVGFGPSLASESRSPAKDRTP
ncbi:hypothetical protein Shyhy02_58830 [Streptomyces hygroscopicus subsp. hygroscopicus]|nr:hypothetical protein Shyhy02_58830 [Streptomyces hygroscopicus subsp. hygroscopicus]